MKISHESQFLLSEKPILDEISILSPITIDEAYQCALKEEEKINRKKNSRRGGGSSRGRYIAYTRNIYNIRCTFFI